MSPTDTASPPKRRCSTAEKLAQLYAPGIRCEALILMGFIWMTLGWGVINDIPEPRGGLLFELVPGTLRAVVWITTGAFAMYAGLRSHLTEVALGLLTVMPLLRLVSYLLASADSHHLFNMPGPPFAGGWYFSSFYVVQVAFIVFAARIPPGLNRGSRFRRGGQST